MNPFRYPDSLHRRVQSPERFGDYRHYKPFLRQEFGWRCVYCCLPDCRREDSFGVDHYRPRSRFPELECEYSNLFYACSACNRRKGAFWPDERQWSQGLFIPNPCDFTMSDHLRFEGTRVEALSSAGQFTEEILLLNDERDILYREFLLRSIERCLEELTDALRTLRNLDKCLRRAEATDRDEMLSRRRVLLERISATREDVERLAGVQL